MSCKTKQTFYLQRVKAGFVFPYDCAQQLICQTWKVGGRKVKNVAVKWKWCYLFLQWFLYYTIHREERNILTEPNSNHAPFYFLLHFPSSLTLSKNSSRWDLTGWFFSLALFLAFIIRQSNQVMVMKVSCLFKIYIKKYKVLSRMNEF